MTKHNYILIQIIIMFYFIVIGTEAVSRGDPCNTPNGHRGSCVRFNDCPYLLKFLNNNNKYDNHTITFLRKSECSLKNKLFCCPSSTHINKKPFENNTCINPNGRSGSCVRQSDCPYLKAIFRYTNRFDVYTKTFLHQSECSQKPRHYCCPSDTGSRITPLECNRPVTIENRIYGGKEAELKEFAWMANLENKHPTHGLTEGCSGNIISKRYILTVSHCLTREFQKKHGKLVSVRVGDHNRKTRNDCDDSECIQYQRLGVEEFTLHPKYNTKSIYEYRYDIGLIRTDANIQYSDSVVPICLPDIALSHRRELIAGTKLFVGGWGATNANTSNSDAKLIVEVPYVKNRHCIFRVAPEQMCAGGEFGKDTCMGDSGGGLVRQVDNVWILEGLVSYGYGCGLQLPGVYTRVSKFIPWILSNVKP